MFLGATRVLDAFLDNAAPIEYGILACSPDIPVNHVMQSQKTPAEPRPAASVILVRDSAQGIEVFLVERHGRADFAGANVFPGGILEESDTCSPDLCRGLDDTQASGELGVTRGGLAYWVAGIRECFEESGYLLAYDREGAHPSLSDSAARSRFMGYREALQSGAITIGAICEKEKLKLALDCMHYFGFFITPEAAKRRYSTRFFIAGVPRKQVGMHDGSETVSSRWITPELALRLYRENRFVLAPPTVIILKQLSGQLDAGGVLEAAKQRNKAEIPAILPTVKREGKTVTVHIPGHPDIVDKFL